ncbi:hypothetical protein F444_20558 [Phytophthora nicotianae P1976]|uniref:Uncharacterized protein n=1 Tax=Phytophthora nicotianae P1976 TaxID=1317066 RepID=A0A080Z469_PHYNI|nr:hypothetical protein F444_20558 [Phytophthora nicotianae P1976]
MNLRALVMALLTLVACTTATVDHDKIEPFPQPEQVTISEKAAIKFKPQLGSTKIVSEKVCVPYPAVNAAGEVTGGLKETNGNFCELAKPSTPGSVAPVSLLKTAIVLIKRSLFVVPQVGLIIHIAACKYAPKGSQVYGRARWHKDLWAIMYTWYFPKGFWMGFPTRRHDWKSVVVWIDNPSLEEPKIVGVSMSESDTKYNKETRIWPSNFVVTEMEGPRSHRTYINGSNTSFRFQNQMPMSLKLAQDLITWEQLTDAARVALNDNAKFGTAEVPFSDTHYEDHLDNAWPL